MPFSEAIKKRARDKANHICCWCRDPRRRIDVHHIVPEAEGGEDTLDNAAPLCAGCHADFGDNPKLRKQLRERRDRLFRENSSSRPSIERFWTLLDEAQWFQERIYDGPVWICEEDILYQVDVDWEKGRDFTETWTQVYASNVSLQYPVNLRIRGVIVKQLSFVSCDGGRIMVALPRVRYGNDGSPTYYWERNSLDFKVMELIGDYYIWQSIEGMAGHSNIEIVD